MRLHEGDHTVWMSPQGGSILQWQWQDHTILGPARMVSVGNEVKVRGESHWCSPNFGAVPESVAKKYPGPKHGRLRSTTLKVLNSDKGGASFFMEERVDLTLFESTVNVAVEENAVSTWLTLRNAGMKRAPILPAYHPYFATPARGLAVLMDGQVVGQASRGGFAYNISSKSHTIPVTGEFQVELDGIGLVTLLHTQNCSHIVLWSDDPTQYVCVEPVFGTPGTFGLQGGAVLESGRHIHCSVDFKFTPT